MKIEVRKAVDVPHDALWAAISDFAGTQNFNPVVETSVLTGDTPNQGLGIQRLCTFYDGNSILETVKDWRDKSGFTVEMTEMNMPFKSAHATLDALPAGDGKSVITMTLEATPKYGIFGALMGAVMIRPMMTKMMGSVVDGLAHHAQTGDLIGKDGVATKAAAVGAAGPEFVAA
ncbi:MAG: SRPBCC family protein [Alphaproteobacteria bacterium]|jgi:carbon monoxide dehydrogenase subunit G|nr:SRPBCC family protein [Alphaproteobacteria bacterium]MBT5860753.1 SRPBCC family protein [Alphaproteobacteria bacterium]